jgi:hypothetical protein
MKEAEWFKGHIDKAISQWVRGMAAADRAARTLRRDQFYELYYEDLVADPEAELRRLCDFIGEDYAPAMAAPAEVAAYAVPERKTWHALTHGDVTASRVGTWRDRLEPEEIGLCERVMGRQLRRRGYEVTGEFQVSVSRQLRYAKRTFQKFCERAPRQVAIRVDRLRRPADLSAQARSSQRIPSQASAWIESHSRF